MSSLKEVYTLGIWMGTIKGKDAGRVSKGLDRVGKCEKFPGEPECVNMVTELTTEVNRVSQGSEVLTSLQNSDVEGILINSKETIATPENRPSQKGSSLPTIHFRGYDSFREGINYKPKQNAPF